MFEISSKLSYANVTATLALFAALGGGAYAATTFVRPGGVVDLCVSGKGAVKVLAAKQSKCGTGTTLVPINQQGKPGPPGSGSTLTYSAGSGLTLSGTSFAIDPAKVQSRIGGSGCAADQALQAVGQDGTPACTSLHAYSAVAGTANYLQNNAAVAVPAGRWLLLGQAPMVTGGSPDSITCQLQVGSQIVDRIVQALPAGSNYVISPMATTTTTGPSSVVQILCVGGSGSTAIGAQLTIVALPLAALN
jgi:hypothetical protein